LVVRDKGNNKIIGMGSIYFIRTLGGFKGYIEDVVIDKNYRGLGLGRRLVCKLIEVAKEHGATRIDLTSNPKRKIANALYIKLGFKKINTNFYRLELAQR